MLKKTVREGNTYRLQDVISYLVEGVCPEIYCGDTPRGRNLARCALREAGVVVPRTARTAADLLRLAEDAGVEAGFDPRTGEYRAIHGIAGTAAKEEAMTEKTPVNVHGGHTSQASRAAWAGWIMGQVQAEKGSGLGLFDRSMAALLSGYGHDLPSPQRRAALLDSIKRVKGR